MKNTDWDFVTFYKLFIIYLYFVKCTIILFPISVRILVIKHIASLSKLKFSGV